jgi:DnaJ-domain-containing protein 1
VTQEKFLIIDGMLVGGGLLAFWIMRRMNKEESHFRDDIWDTSLKGKALPKDPIDRKILLGYRPDPELTPHDDTPKSGADFLPPKFAGKPHEVLGILPTAGKEVIQAAFRHWMKRYHPDRVTHLGPEYVEQARARAEQLNAAREAMLRVMR